MSHDCIVCTFRRLIARTLTICAISFSLILWLSFFSGCKSNDGFIIFERDYKLMRSNQNGEGEITITEGFDTNPAVSADGQLIAYAHSASDPRTPGTSGTNPPPAASLYVANADGGNPQRVTPQEWETSSGWELIFPVPEGTTWMQRDCCQPSFSRDGTKMVFKMTDRAWQETTEWGGEYDMEAIAVIDISGPSKGELNILVKEGDAIVPGGLTCPRFSNDGKYIYFYDIYSGGPPESSIFRISTSGGEKRLVAEGNEDKGYYALDISPKDGSIATVEISWNYRIFGSSLQGNIVLMNSDGSNKRYIKTDEYVDVGYDSIRFSPDGDSLVFSTHRFGSHPDSQSNIYTVNTNGTNLKKIITNGRDAAWGKETDVK